MRRLQKAGTRISGCTVHSLHEHDLKPSPDLGLQMPTWGLQSRRLLNDELSAAERGGRVLLVSVYDDERGKSQAGNFTGTRGDRHVFDLELVDGDYY